MSARIIEYYFALASPWSYLGNDRLRAVAAACDAAAAEQPETARLYESQTERAIARGVFGMPFYIYRDEPFWGQDRLEMLDAALGS